MMILSGRFIGFLPCHIADQWVERHEMRRLRPDTYAFVSQHFAALRQNDTDHPLISRFLKEFEAAWGVRTGNRRNRRKAKAEQASG